MPLPEHILRTFQEVGRDLYQLALVTSHGGTIDVQGSVFTVRLPLAIGSAA